MKQAITEITRYFVFIAFMIALLTCGYARADSVDHRWYAGLGWTHFSNLDAGTPFNADPEDSADHVGLELEYQAVESDGDYFYFTGTIGRTKMNRADRSYSGWDCSGCSFPATIRVGYRWRLD
jgi:hypothetical protein